MMRIHPFIDGVGEFSEDQWLIVTKRKKEKKEG